MISPKFSIAIPAFKAAFLKECIQSVLDQTYTNFELIIVNDASPENIEQVIEGFTDPRIIYQKNATGFGGLNVSKNWDKCLSLAHGEFFICMGDDDKLLPDCLEKYLKLIDSYPNLDIYHAGTQMINPESEIIDLQESRPVWESVYSMIWHRWFMSRKSYIGDFLFRTDVLKEKGGFIWSPYAWHSDDQTVYSIARSRGIANMQEYGFQYRVHPQSISGRGDLYVEKAEAMAIGDQWYDSFLEEQPSDPNDYVFWKLILKGKEWFFNNWYYLMLRNDFRVNNLKHIGYWIKNRKKYRFTLKAIIVALFLRLKQIVLE